MYVSTRGILSVPLVTTLAPWIASRLLTCDTGCRSHSRKVGEYLGFSKRYTSHVPSAGNRAPHCTDVWFAGADCWECFSCSVGEVMSCDGDSCGYQLACSVQRWLFFPLGCWGLCPVKRDLHPQWWFEWTVELDESLKWTLRSYQGLPERNRLRQPHHQCIVDIAEEWSHCTGSKFSLQQIPQTNRRNLGPFCCPLRHHWPVCSDSR